MTHGMTPEQAVMQAAELLRTSGFVDGRYGDIPYELKAVEYTFSNSLAEKVVAVVAEGRWLAAVMFSQVVGENEVARIHLRVQDWLKGE